MDERRDISENGRGTFLRELGERFGDTAAVDKVYGVPVERGDMTVIPVARVRYGFGGGTGREADGDEGLGGGGGVHAAPIGYIALHDGRTEFVEIRDRPGERLRLGAAIAVAGIGLWFGLRGLAAVLKATRR